MFNRRELIQLLSGLVALPVLSGKAVAQPPDSPILTESPPVPPVNPLGYRVALLRELPEHSFRNSREIEAYEIRCPGYRRAPIEYAQWEGDDLGFYLCGGRSVFPNLGFGATIVGFCVYPDRGDFPPPFFHPISATVTNGGTVTLDWEVRTHGDLSPVIRDCLEHANGD